MSDFALPRILLIALLASSPPANGEDLESSYLGLSFAGDGTVPSAASLFEAQSRSLAPSRYAAESSPKGDATYGFGLELPPAIVAPSVSVNYSSSGGAHTTVVNGWSISAGMTIEQPSGRAAAAAYANLPGMHFISGGGLSGSLVRYQQSWQYVGNEPAAVVATYDEVSREWTVQSGGLTTILEPSSPHELYAEWDDDEIEPTKWRVRHVEDVDGNAMEYLWDGAYLDEIHYGHCQGVGCPAPYDEHNPYIEVVFDYWTVDVLEQTTDASQGFVEHINRHLTTIDVFTHTDDQSPHEKRLRYDFQYGAMGNGHTVLYQVDQRGYTDGEADGLRVLATMNYTDWNATTSFPVRTDAWGLGQTDTFSVGAQSESRNYESFTDISGDGIPDHLFSSLGGWQTSWGLVDPLSLDNPLSWEGVLDPFNPTGRFNLDARVLDTSGIPGDQLLAANDSSSLICGEDETVSITKNQLIDLNGDGFVDYIAVPEVPDPFPYGDQVDNQPAPFCDDIKRSIERTDWSIWFGGPEGFGPEYVAEAPFEYLRIGGNPKMETYTQGEVDGAVGDGDVVAFEDAVVELRDMNGDSYLDIVHVLPADIDVYLALGGEYVGWEEFPVRWGAHVVGIMKSTGGTHGRVDFDQWLIDIDGVHEWQGVTPTIDYTFGRTSLIDLNADGLVDFVNANTGNRNRWKVFLGNGHGFEDSVNWTVPDLQDPDGAALNYQFMTKSYEGHTQLHGCPAPAPGGIGGLYVRIEEKVGALDIGPAPQAENEAASRCDYGREGADQEQLVGLFDVDGDGRQDFVDAEQEVWYRNLGNGFETVPRLDLPTPLQHNLGQNHSWQELAFNGLPPGQVPEDDKEYYYDYVYQGGSHSVPVVQVGDFNADGLPDRLERHADNGWYMTYGEYSRPGLLTWIQLGTGAETSLSWGPSSEVFPSGDAGGNHRMANHKDLVLSKTVIDPITGHGSTTDISYEDGVCERGICYGFEHVTTVSARNDPELLGEGVYRDVSMTEVEYLLARDYQLPIRRAVSTDFQFPYLVAGMPFAPVLSETWIVETEYDIEIPDAIGGVCGGAPACAELPRAYDNEFVPWDWRQGEMERAQVSHRRSIDVPEDAAAEERIVDVWLYRDALGRVVEARHDGQTPEDDLVTTTSWISNDAGLWVTSEQSTVAWDYVTEQIETIERAQFFYDDQPMGVVTDGKMTTQRVFSGAVGSATLGVDHEYLDWTFRYGGPRGQLDQSADPRGTTSTTTLFGHLGAASAETENALGHVSSTFYDPMGRVAATVDPNGVESATTYDGLGRTVATYVQGAGGAAFLTSTTDYDEEASPQYITSVAWDYAGPDDAGTTAVSHTVLDGFGSPIQEWSPNVANDGFLVTDSVPNIAGTVVRSSRTREISAFSNDFASTRSTVYGSWNDVDAFGATRRTYEDHTTGLGLTMIDLSVPGKVVTKDGDGYIHEAHSDTHGRLVEVHEGQDEQGSVTMQRTGVYRYDGRSRVAIFQDAAGNEHHYQYDGAGRTRQVWRVPVSELPACEGGDTGDTGLTLTDVVCVGGGPGTLGGTLKPYYAYVYDGQFPIEMYEGTIEDRLVVQASYDDLGRVASKQVRNTTNGVTAADQYTWTYDTAWLGAVTQATDPSGQTDYTYAPEVFGAFGRPSDVERTWSLGATASFAYLYDFQGRPIHTTWPQGATVDKVYTPSGFEDFTTLSWVDSGGQDSTASVSHTYDDYGLPSGFFGGQAGRHLMTQEIARTVPTRIAGSDWLVGATTTREIDWHRDNAGRLRQKHITPMEPLLYEYDFLQRIAVFRDAQTNDELEAFQYDAIGNPVQVTRTTGPGGQPWVWDYQPAEFSQVPRRDNATNGFFDRYTFDQKTGRMHGWKTERLGMQNTTRVFAYDGLGRLTRLQTVGMGGFVDIDHEYDGSNNMVLERRTTGPLLENITRFQGSRHDLVSGNLIQEVLPMARLVDGEIWWIHMDADGHALEVLDADGLPQTFEVSGVYGHRIPGLFQGSDWKIDGVHGGEADRARGIVHRGQRHHMLGDGMWLQPEPLLHVGRLEGFPRGATGVYAAANPVGYEDSSGMNPVRLLSSVVVTAWGMGEADQALGQRVQSELAANPQSTFWNVVGGVRAIAHAEPLLFGLVTGRAPTSKMSLGMKSKVPGGECFVAGTEVLTPAGSTSIEDVRRGDVVVAAVPESGSATLASGWVELATARVKRGQQALAIACAALSIGCDVEPNPPAADESVKVFDVRTAQWFDGVGADLNVGDTFIDSGRILRLTGDGLEVRGSATTDDLADADASWLADSVRRLPSVDDWVLVLGSSEDAGHTRLYDVNEGSRFAFQARVFNTVDADGDGDLEIHWAGDALGRVYETHVRDADEVIDLVVSAPNGPETITGTPEHPFWVESVGDYVPLGDLEVGTLLRTVGDGEARVMSVNRRMGALDVFNFEVEDVHNYFVRAPLSQGQGVLVHNGCGPVKRFEVVDDGYADFTKRSATGDGLQGHEVWQHANMKEHGLANRRGAGPASRENPVIALPDRVHTEVNAAQRAFDPRTQTPMQNIDANVEILRNHPAVPNDQVDKIGDAAKAAAEHYGY